MISIAIPCYEMNGRGIEMLEYSFNKIREQNYKDFEVVISDHSMDDKIEGLCKIWSDKFSINYNRFEEKRGSAPANANNCIRNSHGDLIKLLFQDDYLYDSDSLQKTVDSFDDRHMWLVSSYMHTRNRIEYFNEHVPVLNERIHLKNLIGFPSCLTLRNKDVIFFNEDLTWVFDCEYYKRLFMTFGGPVFLRDITVVNYLWEGQLTHSVNPEIRYKEKQFVANLYGDTLHSDEMD
jgi:glycosyltransferase involved in cell wall biosynthesis